MNRAIVRTSDPARQPRVHATTASATDLALLKPIYGLTETALKGASHAFHQQPQHKDTLRQALVLIGTRASRAYPEEIVVA